MQIEVKKYSLPDINIFNDETAKRKFSFWIPDKKYLILGQSNQAETSLIADRVLDDNVEVYKRPSGGESVILTPKTLVVSGVLETEKFENPSQYFKKFNNIILAGLIELGVKDLGQKGISDIAIGKKILGSSIYRRKNKVFYHAVINIGESIETIAYYLQHPKKEPDYRKGRDHKEFVTSLHEQGYEISPEKLQSILEKHFTQNAPE